MASHPSHQSNSLLTESTPSVNYLSNLTNIEVFEPEVSYSGQETPLTNIRTMDQIDLLTDVAFQTSALKRLSEEAVKNPEVEKVFEECFDCDQIYGRDIGEM